MKTKEIVVGVVVVVAIIAFTFIYTQKQDVKEVSSSASNIFKSEFVGGCMSEGDNYEFCSCTYDYMAQDIGEGRLIEESIKYDQSGVFSDVLVESIAGAITECL